MIEKNVWRGERGGDQNRERERGGSKESEREREREREGWDKYTHCRGGGDIRERGDTKRDDLMTFMI